MEKLQNDNLNLIQLLTKKDDELVECRSKVSSLEHKIDCLEQEKLSNNMVIHNIPKINDESCVEIVKKIASKPDAPILVKFDNSENKSNMIRKLKEKKYIKLEDLDYTNGNGKFDNLHKP